MFIEGSQNGSLQTQRAVDHFDSIVFTGTAPSTGSNNEAGTESEIELGLEDLTLGDESDQMNDVDSDFAATPISGFSSASGYIPGTSHRSTSRVPRPLASNAPPPLSPLGLRHHSGIAPLIDNTSPSAHGSAHSNPEANPRPSVLSQQRLTATMASATAPPAVSDSESELSTDFEESSMHGADTPASESTAGAGTGAHISSHQGVGVSMTLPVYLPPPPVPTTTKPVSRGQRPSRPEVRPTSEPVPNLVEDAALQIMPAPKQKRAKPTKNVVVDVETANPGLPAPGPRRTGRTIPTKRTS